MNITGFSLNSKWNSVYYYEYGTVNGNVKLEQNKGKDNIIEIHAMNGSYFKSCTQEQVKGCCTNLIVEDGAKFKEN